MNRDELNRIIAEFMVPDWRDHVTNGKIPTDDAYVIMCLHVEGSIGYLKYDKSWDWLIPVYSKCCKLPPPTKRGWIKADRMEECVPPNAFEQNDIEAVYTEIVEFIKWYNGSTRQ